MKILTIAVLSSIATLVLYALIKRNKKKFNKINEFNNKAPSVRNEPLKDDFQQEMYEENRQKEHPILRYQEENSGFTIPASIGDAIRIPTSIGPIYSSYGRDGGGLGTYQQSYSPPGTSGAGPYPGEPMGVPVPMGSLRYYSERYNPTQFRLPNPNFNPVYDGSPGIYNPIVYKGNTELEASPRVLLPQQTLPTQQTLASDQYFRPYGPNAPTDVPFFGNVNAYSPFPEIVNPWEKAGILTSMPQNTLEHNRNISNDDRILNLYRRPIAPVQNLWEYQVQDKNGFVIKLNNKYIEDGDIITHIIGKEGLGPWRATIFVQNKYIWV